MLVFLLQSCLNLEWFATPFFPINPVTAECKYLLKHIYLLVAAAAKLLQSCPTLCDPIDGSPPVSPVPGILQARTWVGCHFLLQGVEVKSESEVVQSCLTLRDPVDCSLPGSSAHGIFQARVLEWAATAFSESLLYQGANHIFWLLRLHIAKRRWHSHSYHIIQGNYHGSW